MIKRIYINNFKTFINFEARLDNFHLLAGPNGAGKSALFDVIKRLKWFVYDNKRLEKCFPAKYKSRGLSDASNLLTIELDMENDQGDVYFYSLEVEYEIQSGKQRVQSECLEQGNIALFEARKGEAQLYRDDGTQGPHFPMDWGQSGVGFLNPGKDNQRLTLFKEELGRVAVFRINPGAISGESRQEADELSPDLSNFADWYRYVVLSEPQAQMNLTEDLQQRLPAFRNLKLHAAGEGRLLYATFVAETGEEIDIPFSELSDGQKVLIGLYAIKNTLFANQRSTLCLDEPENYLALPEVQPWLDELYEASQEQDGANQALLISHHPRVINFLSADTGLWLERANEMGPTRIKPIGQKGTADISVDQMIERGWIDAV